jgi:thioredoxin reductase (NADPH)
MRLTLLSRAYCHLCDEMLAAAQPLAAAHATSIDVVDVDDPANAALEAEWGDQIPALFAGKPGASTLLCQHRLDRDRLEAFLGGAGATRD